MAAAVHDCNSHKVKLLLISSLGSLASLTGMSWGSPTPMLLLEIMEAEMPPALGEAAPPDPVGLCYFTSVEDLILCLK